MILAPIHGQAERRLPAAVHGHGHAYYNGKIYVIGGRDPANVAQTAVYVYDIGGNNWTTLAPIPEATYGVATGVIGGNIYVAGPGNLHIYDIAADSWSTGPPIPFSVYDSAGTVVTGKLWVIGEFNPVGFNPMQVYDPIANIWSNGPSQNEPSGQMDAVTLNVPGGQMALVVGGFYITHGGRHHAGPGRGQPDNNLSRSITDADADSNDYIHPDTNGNADPDGNANSNVVINQFYLFWRDAGDQRGSGISISNGAIYVSGASESNQGDGLVARFAIPVVNDATPVWNKTWPTLDGSDNFEGVGVSDEGVYVAGSSYNRTVDPVGGKENKGITVKFPLSGPPGGGYDGSIWDVQTPAPPGAFPYGGSEGLSAATVTIEGGLPVVYVTGFSQSGGGNGCRLYVSKVSADGTVLWTHNDGPAVPCSQGLAITTFGENVYVAGRNDDAGMQPYLLKYPASGGPLIWARKSTEFNGFYNGVTAYAGAIYAFGQRQNGVGGSVDFLVEKWDEAGIRQWSRQYDRGSLEDILYAGVGLGTSIYAVGSTTAAGAGGRDMAVLKLDASTGDLNGTTLYGGAQDDIARGVATDGNSLFVIGESRSFASATGNLVGQNDLALLNFGVSSSVSNRTLFDYDGDGKSDISVFRPSRRGVVFAAVNGGALWNLVWFRTDKITPADYDGDGKTDIAVYRPSTGIWYVFNSSNGTVSYYVFGLAEDLPTPADYDGDGKADISVFRPSTATWYRQNSSDGSFYAIQFGPSEDKPTIGDFDGDGKADIAIFRPSDGAWYQLYSSDDSLHGREFGFGTDVIVPADYDGDGKTDIAVFRPSTGIWYIRNSSDGTVTYNVFGLADDIPAPGDFDGDGKADISVFRPSDGTWYRMNSSDGSFFAFQFGTNGDKPTQTAFRY